jgi:AhpD family alkylhydroperoxidase
MTTLNRNKNFNKRFYLPRTFAIDFFDLIKHLPEMRQNRKNSWLEPLFAEKIMLVVTQVNGCRYCSFGHTALALKGGMNNQELQKLLALEIDDFPEDEAVALTFAQHFAETNRQPDPQVLKRFEEHYGSERSKEIMNQIRMISFGNRAGNTYDAFISRMKGAPAKDSNFLGELILFILFTPFILPLLVLMRKKKPQFSSTE